MNGNWWLRHQSQGMFLSATPHLLRGWPVWLNKKSWERDAIKQYYDGTHLTVVCGFHVFHYAVKRHTTGEKIRPYFLSNCKVNGQAWCSVHSMYTPFRAFNPHIPCVHFMKYQNKLESTCHLMVYTQSLSAPHMKIIFGFTFNIGHGSLKRGGFRRW